MKTTRVFVLHNGQVVDRMDWPPALDLPRSLMWECGVHLRVPAVRRAEIGPQGIVRYDLIVKGRVGK